MQTFLCGILLHVVSSFSLRSGSSKYPHLCYSSRVALEYTVTDFNFNNSPSNGHDVLGTQLPNGMILRNV